MSRIPEPMRLTADDLFSPQVETYLESQRIQRRDVVEMEERPWYAKVFYSSYFYLSLASGLGAFLAWACIEPFYDDGVPGAARKTILADFLLFPSVAAGIGVFLGAAEGIICRNLPRALLCALVGLLVGFVGGFVSLIAAEVVFAIMNVVAASFVKNPNGGRIGGLAFLILMMGRASAWAIAAIPAGIGQGIALRDRKVIFNGLLGGVLGGLLGGILFDPINFTFSTEDGGAELSRGIGLTIIGLTVGLLVGVVEQWTKTAWVMMKSGPLAGKQFILYRNPTVLGSSPRADIYLFKDEAIEPQHALIHNRGGRFEIEDMNSADGVYVNGLQIQRRILQPGDKIVLGKTQLEFSVRDTE